MAEVRIICTRTVVSTRPVQVGKCHALSVLDRIMEKKHLRMVLYYPSMGVTEPGEVTRRRRESISGELISFPIMTGRLERNERGQWSAKYNDAGVRMVEARAEGTLEEWLRNVDREKELMLVYWEEMDHHPLFWSTFYLTEFEDGGLAIGLSGTHLLADLTSATVFLKAWADTSFPGQMLQPPLFHPLPPRRPGNRTPDHRPYTSLINHYKYSIKKSMHPANKKHTTVAFAFSESMVRACIAMAQPIGATNRSNPSPF
ncbi:putative vinorine synthase [Rosa chinensis]|uniref:Putative vinorine synthase n=1 Tax=Rosa chinensis TaxID=74649 RepID=A0A2P6PY35_ROSCH|nr:putative vinorine synthase [Rosa chinensis]